ncbi:MAG: hypothetical protein JWM78_1678 [Verrucomicrobiaceae bacterium]|nr:hypothetical protein [Verrucomicrobiaceae bacterium]
MIIENWRDLPRRWSMRLGLAGSLIASYLIASPDAAITAWNLLPPELRGAIPQKYMPLIGTALFGLSLLAQLFKQKKLIKGAPDNAAS